MRIASVNAPQGQPLRYALVGDGESPHLLKWARALDPLVELWVCSSRGFAPELAALVPPTKRLALGSNPEFTSSVLVAYARAVMRMRRMGDIGAKTAFDVAPGLLSPKSAADLRKELL